MKKGITSKVGARHNSKKNIEPVQIQKQKKKKADLEFDVSEFENYKNEPHKNIGSSLDEFFIGESSKNC
jgi:hypothetical protein